MRKLALLTLLLFACKNKQDEEARARIFSPEQPVGVAAEAKQPLDAARLAEDAALAQRVLHMPQGEVAQRLGPHKAQQRVQFAWFRGPGLPDGGSEVSLAEETTLTDAQGDDFTVKLSNDHNQGFELAWAKGEVFVKSLYGPFRKRRTDRTDPQRVREQAMSGLATFDRLARGLKLRPLGEATVEGRRAVRYGVDGYGARTADKEKTDLPAVEYPGGNKVDPDTARRLELWEKEEPVSVSGTLAVDAQTGAPLSCDLQGRFKVNGPRGQPAAELDLHSVLVTTSVGQELAVRTPKWEPEPSVPHAVKDPLRFLGKEPGAEPGEASTEEPDSSDDDEAEAPAAAVPAPAEKPR
ncbi:MAG TPA: hypothetical protein VLW85_12120 [Myxococcales bacterium]|nr:hypothetical protein [Myxococcales bacterium]